MSIETPQVNPEEQKVAEELMNENPTLLDDEFTRTMVRSGGITETGEKVDLGDFLVARKTFLELQQSKGNVAASKVFKWASMITHSVRPDLEEK